MWSLGEIRPKAYTAWVRSRTTKDSSRFTLLKCVDVGSCTLNNVYFEDVCEDAVTFRQIGGVSTINGGGVSMHRFQAEQLKLTTLTRPRYSPCASLQFGGSVDHTFLSECAG